MQLVANGNVTPDTDLYFDNLFTSSPLRTELSKLGIAGTGTMRQNRLHKVPLPDKKKTTNELKSGDTLSVNKDDHITLVWKDTKPYYLSWIQWTRY